MSALAATAEQRFAARQSELVALRERQSDPDGWRLLTDAVAFLDGRVAAQMGQWRATMSAEIGATPETDVLVAHHFTEYVTQITIFSSCTSTIIFICTSTIISTECLFVFV